jgi:hypothetical protein
MAAPSEVTVDNLQPQIEDTFCGAVAAARAMLPAMREAGAGTLLFTTGGGSLHPIPVLGNINVAGGALRNWVLNVHKEGAPSADRGHCVTGSGGDGRAGSATVLSGYLPQIFRYASW